MIIRKLEKSDYDLNYFDLLSQLTICPKPTQDEFNNFIDNIGQSDIYVLLNESQTKIIGTGTLLIEKKIIHQMGKIGHIEDIVIDKDYRGQGYGQLMINFLIHCGREKKCYKMLLNCQEDKVSFYEKCNFQQKGFEMVHYF